MKGLERQTQSEIEWQLALSEARKRGLTDEDIAKFTISNRATAGGIFRERAERKNLDAPDFASNLGISPEDLRAIYFGFAKPPKIKEVFPKIKQELGFGENDLKFLMKILPYLFDED